MKNLIKSYSYSASLEASTSVANTDVTGKQSNYAASWQRRDCWNHQHTRISCDQQHLADSITVADCVDWTQLNTIKASVIHSMFHLESIS